MSPLLGSFAKEVMLCIGYYGVTFRGHPPERLILTGGDGLEPRLADALTQQCKIPVGDEEHGSPLERLMGEIQAILHRDPGPPAAWDVAAGLGLRGVSAGRRRGIAASAQGQEAA